MVSVKEKAYGGSQSVEDQGDKRKRTTDQVSKIRNELNTGGYIYARMSPGKPPCRLGGIRHKGGVILIYTPVGNVGNSCPDVKRVIQMENP